MFNRIRTSMLGVVVAGLLAPGSAWGQWEEVAKLTASDPAPHDLFGHSVALDGDTAVIGAASDDHAGRRQRAEGGRRKAEGRRSREWVIGFGLIGI